MGIPTWGLVTIVILVLAIVCGLVFFCVRRFLKKRRTKDGKGKKGVDMKSVQLLGSAYKEKVSIPLLLNQVSYCLLLFFKVQPDMEELTENAEEDEESKHSEQKLGKLQYKVNSCVFVCLWYKTTSPTTKLLNQSLCSTLFRNSYTAFNGRMVSTCLSTCFCRLFDFFLFLESIFWYFGTGITSFWDFWVILWFWIHIIYDYFQCLIVINMYFLHIRSILVSFCCIHRFLSLFLKVTKPWI